jgi:hypothetical protein
VSSTNEAVIEKPRLPQPGDPVPDQPDVLMEEFIEQSVLRESLKLELASVETRLKELEDPALTYFQQTSTQKVTRRGRTVFVNREIWAKYRAGAVAFLPGVTPEEISAAMRLCEVDLPPPESDGFMEAAYRALARIVANCREEERALPDGLLFVVQTGDATKEQVNAALKACGMGDMVAETFNSQTVSAYLRDLDKQGLPVPAQLAAVLDASETFKLKVRKS